MVSMYLSRGVRAAVHAPPQRRGELAPRVEVEAQERDVVLVPHRGVGRVVRAADEERNLVPASIHLHPMGIGAISVILTEWLQFPMGNRIHYEYSSE